MTAAVIGLAASGAKADADADSKARVVAMAMDFMVGMSTCVEVCVGGFGGAFGGLKTILPLLDFRLSSPQSQD